MRKQRGGQSPERDPPSPSFHSCEFSLCVKLVCCLSLSLGVCVLQHPDSKMMQINLTGFLNGKNAREFMRDLWPLLLSAQDNIAGIPSAFLEQKKEEIKQRQVSNQTQSQPCQAFVLGLNDLDA